MENPNLKRLSQIDTKDLNAILLRGFNEGLKKGSQKLEDFKAKYGSEGLQCLILQLKYLSQKGGYLQSKVDIETIDNVVSAIDVLMRDE